LAEDKDLLYHKGGEGRRGKSEKGVERLTGMHAWSSILKIWNDSTVMEVVILVKHCDTHLITYL